MSKNAPPTHKKRAPKTAYDDPGIPTSLPATSEDAFTFPDDPLCDLPVPGRLRDSADFWRNELHASESVINNITKGWPVPWTNNTRPDITLHYQNPHFDRTEQLFMWDFAMSLKNKGIIRMSPTIPKVVLSAFTREKTDNLPNTPIGRRFLVNGRPLKQFMDVPHFRLEDLISMVSQLRPGSTSYHCVKVDLKDAYFCCPIPED